MPELIEALRNQPFNLALFFLVIFLSIWITNLLREAKPWAGVAFFFTELMAGIVFGLLIGFALTFHHLTGILSISSVTVGIVLIFNAPKERKVARFLSVGAALVTALLIYWYIWEDFGLLLEIIIEDFL
jgi:hypothetical protein